MSKLEKITDFSDYKFRCHALGQLMVGMHTGLTEKQKIEYAKLYPRSKGEGRPLTDNQIVELGKLIEKKNQKPELSKTAKNHCKKIFNEEFHGRKREFSNKYTEKGLLVEQKSLTAYSDFKGKLLVKNTERFTNDFITGLPDLVGPNEDIKSSWSLDTFPAFDEELSNDDNIWQMRGYNWLTGDSVGNVIYVLSNTPEALVQDEKFRLARNLGVIDLPLDAEEEIEWAHNFEDIPLEKRVRVFPVELDETHIELIKQQVTLGREYLNQLVKNYWSLNIAS